LELGASFRRAFTLLELLVVLAIIGLVVAISLPSIKGLSQSNIMADANQQLLADIARARRAALKDRSTVFVIFMPPADAANPAAYASLSGIQKTNLLRGQQTAYALYAARTAGDQPGRPYARYLTGWQNLPEGVFIPTWKFFGGTNGIPPFKTLKGIPIPAITNTAVSTVPVPYLAFDPLGRLTAFDAQGRPLAPRDEIIPLARGSVFFARDAAGGLDWAPADVLERPPGNSVYNWNHIHIEWTTGRARVERPEIQ
jgi:prepilin-type N-terminal cleavage/methylation domain-containing protein